MGAREQCYLMTRAGHMQGHTCSTADCAELSFQKPQVMLHMSPDLRSNHRVAPRSSKSPAHDWRRETSHGLVPLGGRGPEIRLHVRPRVSYAR